MCNSVFIQVTIICTQVNGIVIFSSHETNRDLAMHEHRNMMTASNGNISELLALRERNPPVTGGFPS